MLPQTYDSRTVQILLWWVFYSFYEGKNIVKFHHIINTLAMNDSINHQSRTKPVFFPPPLSPPLSIACKQSIVAGAKRLETFFFTGTARAAVLCCTQDQVKERRERKKSFLVLLSPIDVSPLSWLKKNQPTHSGRQNTSGNKEQLTHWSNSFSL